jgi:hypothetical protein
MRLAVPNSINQELVKSTSGRGPVHVFELRAILKFGAVHELWCRPAPLMLSVRPPSSGESRVNLSPRRNNKVPRVLTRVGSHQSASTLTLSERVNHTMSGVREAAPAESFIAPSRISCSYTCVLRCAAARRAGFRNVRSIADETSGAFLGRIGSHGLWRELCRNFC